MLRGYVHLIELTPVKTTPKGMWLKERPPFSKKAVWVSSTATKRYAYPTQELAWASFRARSKRRVSVLKDQLHQAAAVANFAESEEAKTGSVPGFYPPSVVSRFEGY